MRGQLQPSTTEEVETMLRLAYRNKIKVKFLDYIKDAEARNYCVGTDAIEIYNDESIDKIADTCRRQLKKQGLNVNQAHVDDLKVFMSNLSYVPTF